MNNLLTKYTDEMYRKNLSKNTIEAYKSDIENFESFIVNRNKKFKDVDKLEIMAYVQYLSKLGKADASVERNIVSIRRFYKYMVKSGFIYENPAENYKMHVIKRKLPEILTIDEVDRLLNAPNIKSNKGIRDKSMLEMMYATGMKVSELLSVKISDVNSELSFIKCIGVKGKERIIPIGSCALEWFENYMKIRDSINTKNIENLYINMHGDIMTRQGFFKIIKQYASNVEIKKHIDSYTLRHCFAVHFLQNGADIKTVQELLGHSNLTTTQIYSGVTRKSRTAEIYKKFHPRA
ncbi:MAG: tyrosine recombinase XerD [Clostridium sp.]|nr:tyrosine recombinase XerD [Clostridium sp.]